MRFAGATDTDQKQQVQISCKADFKAGKTVSLAAHLSG
jgi:hypothetical protein